MDDGCFWAEEGLINEMDSLVDVLIRTLPKLKERIQPVQSYSRDVWDHISNITSAKYRKGARAVERAAEKERKQEKQA